MQNLCCILPHALPSSDPQAACTKRSSAYQHSSAAQPHVYQLQLKPPGAALRDSTWHLSSQKLQPHTVWHGPLLASSFASACALFLCSSLPYILLTTHSTGNLIPGAQTFINGWAPYFRCLEQPHLAPGNQEFAPGSQKPVPADNRSLYPQMAPDLHWDRLLYSRATVTTFPLSYLDCLLCWPPVARHLVSAALQAGCCTYTCTVAACWLLLPSLGVIAVPPAS